MVPEEGLAVASNNATEGRQPTLRRVASQTHTSLRTEDFKPSFGGGQKRDYRHTTVKTRNLNRVNREAVLTIVRTQSGPIAIEEVRGVLCRPRVRHTQMDTWADCAIDTYGQLPILIG